jgi:hypothetical protein
MDCPGALTRRGRLLMRLVWLVAKYRARLCVRGPQPCSCTRGLAIPARRSRLVSRSASRSGLAAHQSSPANSPRLDGQLTHMVLARRRRAQGHKWPGSTTLSRGGSSAARRPAHRKGVHGDASRRRRVNTGRDQERGKEKVAARCSRWVGGVVVAGSGKTGGAV